MQLNLFETNKYKFFSLGSGSSGNCYYLGCKDYGILIDAGIGMRSVKKALLEYGASLSKISAILITHDHADHTKNVGAFGDKYNIPIYATEYVHQGIQRNIRVKADLISTKRVIEKEVSFKINDFEITAFEVPHDSIDNVGYWIKFNEQNLVLITDIGRITETIKNYANKANHLIIEANYDDEMLLKGRYPHYLKQRIVSGMGHLSNGLLAEFIGEIYSDRLKNIWLCHLSQDNNRPELAYETIKNTLTEKGAIVGKNIHLEALSRHKVSGLREL